MTQISARVFGGNRIVTFKNNINLKFALFQITNQSLLNQQVLKGVIFIDIYKFVVSSSEQKSQHRNDPPSV
jgi:hypothetical protein